MSRLIFQTALLVYTYNSIADSVMIKSDKAIKRKVSRWCDMNISASDIAIDYYTSLNIISVHRAVLRTSVRKRAIKRARMR